MGLRHCVPGFRADPNARWPAAGATTDLYRAVADGRDPRLADTLGVNLDLIYSCNFWYARFRYSEV